MVFDLLNKTIQSVLDEPDMFYGVSENLPSPVLDAISLAALHGLAAIELNDQRGTDNGCARTRIRCPAQFHLIRFSHDAQIEPLRVLLVLDI